MPSKGELELQKLEKPLPVSLLLLLGLGVGIIAAAASIIFKALIALFHNLFFFGKFSLIYNPILHTSESLFGIGVILIPVIGGLFVTLLIEKYSSEIKGNGVPEVMYAIYFRKGKIHPLVALLKALTAAISIGSGGSVGREGPIIQIGAALGSTLGQLMPMLAKERILLIAAGLAAGIAATFNTPLTGLLFAIELMLVSINAISVILVAISSIAATFFIHWTFGFHPVFEISNVDVGNYTLSSMGIFVIFGVLLGLISVAFIRGIYFCEDISIKIFKNPYVRHSVGMGLVGIMLYFFMQNFGYYYIEGLGYSTIQEILKSSVTNLWLLVFIFFGKFIATCLTLGTGASGGIFSPSLFLGATFGFCFWTLQHYFLPNLGVGPEVYVIAGMAGIVGAATGAIVTAIVMLFEMTGSFSIILPTMLIAVVSYATRIALCPESVYTLKLFRRGINIPRNFSRDS